MSAFEIGDLITNGSSAGAVQQRVTRDPLWKVSGVVIENVALERFGGYPGNTSFVPDYLASSWRLLPLEWSKIVGGDLEERYVFADGWYQRELRKVEG